MGNVSMRDVAALAGVSVGTVSNVLNAPDRVSEGSRLKVQAAIAKLGWVRNESARQLRAGQSRLIGMVVLDIANPFFTDMAKAAEEAAHELGYAVHVGNSDQQLEREDTHLERFEQERVGGVLLAPVGETGRRIQRLRALGIPVVLLDRASEASEVCSVAVDDIEGGRMAVQHLLDLGHRRMAFVGGPSSLTQVRNRRRGARYATRNDRQARLTEIVTRSLDLSSGVEAAAAVAEIPAEDRPTAVFAANDLLAIGMLQGLLRLGFRVPEDVALVGYDDIDFAAAAAVPLTSVRQPRREMGASAARLLFDEIAARGSGEHEHSAIRFAPEVVVRASSSLPREPPASGRSPLADIP